MTMTFRIFPVKYVLPLWPPYIVGVAMLPRKPCPGNGLLWEGVCSLKWL